MPVLILMKGILEKRKESVGTKTAFLLTILFISLFPVGLCHGESLAIVDEITLSVDEATYTGKEHARFYVSGVYLAGDTTFFSSTVGVLAKISGETGYKEIIGCEDCSDNRWKDSRTAKKKDALFFPGQIWRMSGSGDLVVHDLYISMPYTIELRNWDDVKARIWEDADDKSSIHDVSIYNDLILYGISSGYHDSILAISHVNMSDYRRLFECPPTLVHVLDSLWTDPYCHPAFNPIESTIWLAFDFYNYIYIVDMTGRLVDSVRITDPNFLMPQPPRSRMKSQAVAQDWLSKCTPVRSFRYVSPGYFLLQYRSVWRRLEADSIRLVSTLAWTADRRPVELEVDKLWRLVGVQPDGRVIFAHYLIEDNKAEELILSVARIEP